MIELAVMIEGQDGVNWPRWQRIAQTVDSLGFAGLYRSDHFTNANPPEKDSLDLWLSFTWLASHTRNIEFGSLVSPVSFRDPVLTARMALQVNDLSANANHPQGRLHLGVGAGWNVREHTMFGYELCGLAQRFKRFEEALEIITRLFHSTETPASFSGQFYHLNEAVLLPAPVRPGGPPVLIGGNGARYTLPLVVRYAHEWNAVGLTAEKYAQANATLNGLLQEAGRDPASLRRSLMTTVIFGRSASEVQHKLAGRDPEALKKEGVLIGEASAIADQLHRLENAGVQRIMLRWEDLDNLDDMEALARVLG
jgi:F420-dependent oxidoreductase-like protein